MQFILGLIIIVAVAAVLMVINWLLEKAGWNLGDLFALLIVLAVLAVIAYSLGTLGCMTLFKGIVPFCTLG